ncbi:hypothetical protein V5799_007432 [Amblyomma americanum]|uniref:Uncharacterized protein n=1 Tax=Amblyomma americanum TaxID=6943 RepID=A0AAQ4FFY8_AMBAM
MIPATHRLRMMALLLECVSMPCHADYFFSRRPTSQLSLYPVRTDAQNWVLGSIVRLPYVIRTSEDATVTCTRDGQTVNRFRVRVPRRPSSVRTFEHALVIPNVSPDHAGEYSCTARTAHRESGAVAWQVKPISHSTCGWAESCRETSDSPCDACQCPPQREFYGKNRLYDCYSKRTAGISLRLKDTPEASFIIFNSRRQAAIYYELMTFGDTQVTWTVDGRLVHSHTTLYDSLDTYVTFWERIIFHVPNETDYNRYLNGFLMAQVRGTRKSASLILRVKMNKVMQAMTCGNDSDCSPIGASCKTYTRAMKCRCELPEATRWTGSQTEGHCSKSCRTAQDCSHLGKAYCSQAPETRNYCVCSPGFYLDGNRCLSGECVLSDDCQARYGPSECINGHCECFAGHVYRDGTCMPMVCLGNQDCEDGGRGLRCLGGRCICHHEFDLTRENVCDKSDVGQCHGGGSCRVDNSVCLRGELCYCINGFRAVNLPTGRACLNVSCWTNDDCRGITLATCSNGMCTCPDNEPPRGRACYGSAALTSAELLTPVRLVSTTIVLGAVVVAVLCVTFSFMKSKEDFVSTTLEDEQPAEDEGAVMAAKRALDVVKEQERAAAAEAEAGEEHFWRVLMRSFFPRAAENMFGAVGEEGDISFGTTPVSENTIDI